MLSTRHIPLSNTCNFFIAHHHRCHGATFSPHLFPFSTHVHAIYGNCIPMYQRAKIASSLGGTAGMASWPLVSSHGCLLVSSHGAICPVLTQMRTSAAIVRIYAVTRRTNMVVKLQGVRTPSSDPSPPFCNLDVLIIYRSLEYGLGNLMRTFLVLAMLYKTLLSPPLSLFR